ncbi:MAG: TolC family protein [Bacteroidota bacterium]|nr:TolC family protein [Bacteroidota bacterium]
MMKTYLQIIALLFTGMSIFPAVSGQDSTPESDSLSLSKVLQTVVQGHPSVKEAEEVLNAADARIAMAKSAYLPVVEGNASYSHIGPAPKLTIPGMGSFQLYPSDNYSASVDYHQTLYDFGKTAKNVELESQNKVLTGKNIELVKQKLTSGTIGTFYSLVYLQEAIKIKDIQLKNLREHLAFLEKKQALGTAISYELLVTKVKISNIENQKVDLLTMKKVQLSVLNTLMGSNNSNITVKRDFSLITPALPEDSLVNYAFNHRIEMSIAKEKENVASLQYQTINKQDNASVNVFASAGGKNGYVPELNVVKANYIIGLGVKVPIFDGNRKKNNLAQAQSTINNTGYETELTRRNITNEVVESEANVLSSKQKIGQFELQVSQAEQAFTLAKTSYQSGAITNLDLLDAETSVSESRLQLLKTKVDYMVSISKLKIALGDKLY